MTVTTATIALMAQTNQHRAYGSGAIVMTDGRRYHLVHADSDLVERFSRGGDLLERCSASEIDGDVSHISWCVDELGGFIIV